MRSHSLRGRLLGAMLAVFALGLAASLASYRFAFHNIVSDLRARTLQAQARALAAGLSTPSGGSPEVHLPAGWRAVYADPSRTFTYVIRDEAGHLVAWSANLGAALFPSGGERAAGAPLAAVGPSEHATAAQADRAEPAAAGSQPGHVELDGAGSDRRAVLTVRAPHGYMLTVARGDMSRDTLIDSLVEESTEHLAVLVPFAAFALGLIWVVSGWSLRPLGRASREAALILPGQPDARISTDSLPREILPLVEAVNGALNRLSQAYAVEKRLTTDAAHGLRTPLAVLTLRLQRARLTGAADWHAIERELGEMQRLVEQLLDLARKESSANQSSSAEQPIVNLSRIVREAAASLVPLMESAGRRLKVDVPDDAPLHGRTDDLRDMLRNLLDNARIHGRGTVSVTMRRSAETSRQLLVLEVCDEGRGVPPGREEAVFDRFCKLDAAAPGSGLGLAIVRQVARSHGGEARFAAGRGCVVVTLPAAERPATKIDSVPSLPA